jgi:hypothetical protein
VNVTGNEFTINNETTAIGRCVPSKTSNDSRSVMRHSISKSESDEDRDEKNKEYQNRKFHTNPPFQLAKIA